MLLKMPPPRVAAVLPEMVELVTARLPLSLKIPPLPDPTVLPETVLPEMVELLTMRVPPFKMPAPLLEVVLPEIVELVTVRSPPFQIPPPPDPKEKPPLRLAVLPEMLELLTVRVPALLKAPPKPEVWAPETVTPEIDKSPPEAILKILKLRLVLPLLPLMISEEALGPVMVSEPAPEVAAIVGRAADPRVIVLAPFVNSDEAKIISSLAEVALASVIACLNEPAPASAVVVTVI